MPQITNTQIMLMIEDVKRQVGTLETRLNAYEQDMKANKKILEQIETYSKFIVAFIALLKKLGKWAIGILGLIIAGVIVAYITHLFH
jgi:tetrahydromethanopterin S-methyltransferase subunit G